MNPHYLPSSHAGNTLSRQFNPGRATSAQQVAAFGNGVQIYPAESSSMQMSSVHTAAEAAGAASASQSPLPSSSARCAGLEYANMKKEEAREEYKDRRRRELLEQGQHERVKRRKKNDASMSEDQKYHRRLKMNQDSAAAARHAQEAYVATLEELVKTAEAEKATLAMEASTLRAERDDLANKLNSLHQQVAASVPLVSDAVATAAAASAAGYSSVETSAVTPDTAFEDALLSSMDDPCLDGSSDPLDSLSRNDPAGAVILLKKMMDIFDLPEIPSSMNNDTDFARGIMGIMPAPAV